jgi:hypothetical protein
MTVLADWVDKGPDEAVLGAVGAGLESPLLQFALALMAIEILIAGRYGGGRR